MYLTDYFHFKLLWGAFAKDLQALLLYQLIRLTLIKMIEKINKQD